MCGIAGCINSELLPQHIDLIHHRGPDARGLIQTKLGPHTVNLGHTRLTILELSEAGNQPMFTDCGNYAIVFNGEIYNHLALRAELGRISFKGRSDTETILYYLREFGIDAVSKLNGIFAFAFLDKVKEKLYLVRDQFGVKPLYYFSKGDKLIFGSELKIIKNNTDYTKEIDASALNSYLTLNFNPAPQTLFKNIKKLEAATYLEFSNNGDLRYTKYWDRKQNIDCTITVDDAVSEFKRLMEQAVKRQLLSDVPVGLLLSGGLDSAVLGYLMSINSSNPIQTFTVGFEGKGKFNELEDARDTAKWINADHHEIYLSQKDYMEYYFKSFYYTEEPIAAPPVPALFHVSKLASQSVKVVLSGQGADEPMAGYNRYRGEKFLSDYKKFLSLLPLSLLSKIFPGNHKLDRVIYSSQFKEELDRFIGIYTLFTPSLKENLYQDRLHSHIQDDQRNAFEGLYNSADPSSCSLSKLLYIDTHSLLPDQLLLFNDKITMANSIENRVPFLDIDLIDFIETLPIKMKLNGQVTKFVLRKAAEQWLPASIINRKKRAFETPIGAWFKKELSDTLLQLVESSNSFSRNFFNVQFIEKMIWMHVSEKKDYTKHLFMILSLELWYKDFYLTNDIGKFKMDSL
ncbi:asparagine synthase (glutamine-hydrolyzing) [Cyclobacterium jeungdonense]|uniref:asparagine synthase (glutamine-hydrolyzing) n=1 Tax=Cyclobacterium jeungdonense TaxID=708087 RepID=A0ABT8C948_9BACT|nr:asparagine synthase (glutamine-hydrolyzing) [Cyclobacterium jeungdonense]MDN3688892.1 asparagine synthase (glutamine-hydrolyzing) [Cyclobacterium jeungdonense]